MQEENRMGFFTGGSVNMDIICFLQAFFFSLLETLINGCVDYLWIIVMFYQLFGLAFWRHPFTAVALVRNCCNAKFLQICSDEETNPSTY